MHSRLITCPFCGYAVIEGSDECDECGHSLVHLSRPQPGSQAEARIINDRIRLLEPRVPILVGPQTSVAEVLQLLVERRIGCVIVAEAGYLLGIFSERDALFRLNTRYEDLVDRPIAEFMTHAPETLGPDDKIAFALHRMDVGGYRHIPILTDGALTGVISVRDILRYVNDRILSETAA